MTYLLVDPNRQRYFVITGQLSETEARERLAAFAREETQDRQWHVSDFGRWQVIELRGPLIILE